MRHYHVATVDRLGQVLPAGRDGQLVLLRFHGVEADGGHPGIHTDPLRRLLIVHVAWVELVQALGRIGFQHVLLLQQLQASGGQAPHGIGFGVVLFGEQACRDHPGGVADPVDLDVRMVGVEAVCIFLQVFRFQRGIDGQLVGGNGRAGQAGQGGGEQVAQAVGRFHEASPGAATCRDGSGWQGAVRITCAYGAGRLTWGDARQDLLRLCDEVAANTLDFLGLAPGWAWPAGLAGIGSASQPGLVNAQFAAQPVAEGQHLGALVAHLADQIVAATGFQGAGMRAHQLAAS